MNSFKNTFKLQIHRYLYADLCILALIFLVYWVQVNFASYLPNFESSDIWTLSTERDYVDLFFGVGIVYSFLIFVFGRRITWMVDQRRFFSSHPIDPTMAFWALFLQLYLDILAVTIASFLGEYIVYWSSLNSMNEHLISVPEFRLHMDLSNNLFMVACICLGSMLRPFHYIFTITAAYLFYLAEEYYQIPPFYKSLLELTFGGLTGFFAMKLFCKQFGLIEVKERSILIKLIRKISEHRILQVVLVLVLLSPIAVIANFMNENRKDTLDKIIELRKKVVSTISEQHSESTQYFQFYFHENYNSTFKVIVAEADKHYLGILKEFGLAPTDSLIQVYIGKFDDHLLGAARGNHISLNAPKDPIKAKKKLFLTFRHEITHIIINRLTKNIFSERTDILGSFVHEGIAELVEKNWQPPTDEEIASLALTISSLDKTFQQIIEKASWFGSLDYTLQYDFGHFFWFLFVERYGIQNLIKLLQQIGQRQDEDKKFSSLNFLLNKGGQLGISLYKSISELERKLKKESEKSDLKQFIKRFKYMNVVKYKDNTVLIPYQFEDNIDITCLFRERTKIASIKLKAKKWSYKGQQGFTCQTNIDFYRVAIRLTRSNQWKYQSPWVSPR